MAKPASVVGKPSPTPSPDLPPTSPPVANRWQLIVSSTLLLLWIMFLGWIALAG